MVTTGLSSRPLAKLRMQVSTRRHVELFCHLEIGEFMVCVGYNLLLILSCAVHAIMTRKLPENFNESWYLFVSVCTTSFLWLVFLPAYFTAFEAYHQAALLAFCLFVNSTCNLMCLFVPKIYAVYFVNEKDIKIAPKTCTANSVIVSSGNPSQVAPINDNR